ncbi:Tad domain-containing protein [Clostridium sp. SYSU_GA19001]|uniref:pilus assembly protein TadG-related protein n=1 Tax=Clostridium caldaquaticum TaxID=2940653 RepID=UPI002076E197|nr:pilus assembly protein TadG-related protein [Clostridium caldaquaticum]MCM8710240.1 Tad domain-containing protein [Clostridium caldaquaticum]
MKRLNNKGNAAILLCLLVAAIFGFAAFAIDIGLAYVEKAKLINAMDSAALAGALELPDNTDKAKKAAAEYLEKNELKLEDAIITVGEDKRNIQIKGTKNVKHFFAPVIGIENSKVSASAKAVIGYAKSITGGIRPFAVQIFDFSYGDIVTLKQDAGDGYNGNYGAVALGGQGSSVFKANALYGYNGKISVGDYIDTETGNMAGATNEIKNYINSEISTFNNFPRYSIRLWTLPLVDSFEVNGKGQIKVTGFGKFYVEDIQNKSGKIEITGRFVKFVTNAEIDMNLKDTGLYGVKLSK